MGAVTGALETWVDVMDQLRGEAGLSQDDLAYEARRYGAPSTLTGSWISQLRSGKRPLAPDILRGIAGALGVEPERFAEYRLAMARQLFDEREIGLEEATANLTGLEALVVGEGLPAPPDELAQRLRDVSPSQTDQQPGRSRSRSRSGERRKAA